MPHKVNGVQKEAKGMPLIVLDECHKCARGSLRKSAASMIAQLHNVSLGNSCACWTTQSPLACIHGTMVMTLKLEQSCMDPVVGAMMVLLINHMCIPLCTFACVNGVCSNCYRAKNLVNETGVPTTTGKAVEVLQAELPDAAVLYSSATGVSGTDAAVHACRF